MGFFTSSYVLFSSSSILPILAFVYWFDETKPAHEAAFNNATVAGTMVGMVCFGFLADHLGRRKIYGLEIILLMIGTMGVVTTSAGYVPLDQVSSQDLGSVDYSSFGAMNIQAWFLLWRFISGVGVGGDYPLSAIIASEFSPTSKRPRILAMVFAGQALGSAAVALTTLVVTAIVRARHPPYDPTHPDASAVAVDQIWRWVMGISLVPASLTAVMRFTIPESPRYTLDVRDDPLKAMEETDRLKRPSLEPTATSRPDIEMAASQPMPKEEEVANSSIVGRHGVDSDPQIPGIRQYFWTEGNWRYLLATSVTWFLTDWSTLRLGFNEAPTLSQFWYGPTVLVQNPKVWDSNPVDPEASIYSVLIDNSVHLLAMRCLASAIGIVLFILFITRVNRRVLLWAMSLVLGLLLILNGVVLLETMQSQSWGVNTVLWALSRCSEAFGVAPLTFLIPAELFPTRYRASCHGISAASGKLGAVLASVFLGSVTSGHGQDDTSSPSSSPPALLNYLFIVFAAPMFLCAGISWLWIPDLQDASGKSKTLEQLAEGRRPARSSIAVASHTP